MAGTSPAMTKKLRYGRMLFNSYPFIFLFLPITLIGYFVLVRLNHLAPVILLALASLVFYSVSNWQFVLLLVASIAFNYVIGLLLISKRPRPASRFAALTIGVGGDLLTLGYFKYAGFLAANFNAVFSTGFTVNVLLPVGISFYTFTQIAFLVDAYRGNVARYALPHYALFVTYFPHLIAGPILHHKDMIPQFERAAMRRPDPHLILCGLIIFGIGLFKKTCLADGIQPLVSLAFGPNAPTFDQAWIGALAYTFQLYIPLGGNRHGRTLRYVNLMITMLLGGLWHGAAWTFFAWGALHAVYLCINHAWNNYGPAVAPRFAHLANLAAFILTFLSVVVAWVFFRADSLSSALYVLSKMADPTQVAFGRGEMAYALFIMIYAAIAWFAPNTQTIMGYDHKNRTVGQGLSAWQKRPALLYATAAVLAFGILGIQQHSEFIYS